MRSERTAARREMRHGFASFALISAAGWCLDIATTVLCVMLGASPFFAAAMGAVLAVSFVYLISRYILFSHRRLGTWSDYALYLSYQIVAIALASLAVSGLARALEPLVTGFSMEPLALASGLGKALVTPATLIANFLFMKWLTNPARTGSEPGVAT